MWYIIIIVFLAFGMVFISKFTFQNPKAKSDNKYYKTIDPPLNQNDTIKGMFSRKQIDQKLEYLAKTPAPVKMAFGAECYKIAIINRAVNEYVCPVCGEKTIYKKNKDEDNFDYIDHILNKEIPSCRLELEKIKGINIKLDEKQFCSHCSPAIENPKLNLLVNIAGQTDTTIVSNISPMDIRLIREFLDGKLVHQDDYDFESPLKDNIDRIKELMGVKKNWKLINQ